jgi:hypothetical protein
MTTYSFIQYDVLNNVMSFKGTPTPGLKTLIEDNNSDISSIRDILQNDQYADDTLVPTTASVALIDYLETVTEIDLTKSKTIILTIPIIDDTSIGDTIKIVSKNINGTKTFVNKPKGGLTLPVALIKPSKKYIECFDSLGIDDNKKKLLRDNCNFLNVSSLLCLNTG